MPLPLRFPDLYKDECTHGVDYKIGFYEIAPDAGDDAVTVRLERVPISLAEQAEWQTFLSLLAHELSKEIN